MKSISLRNKCWWRGNRQQFLKSWLTPRIELWQLYNTHIAVSVTAVLLSISHVTVAECHHLQTRWVLSCFTLGCILPTKTTLVAKSRRAVLSSANRRLFTPLRLHLETLTKKITNRIGDKAQLWTQCQGTAITQVIQDRVAHINDPRTARTFWPQLKAGHLCSGGSDKINWDSVSSTITGMQGNNPVEGPDVPLHPRCT